MLKLQQSVSAQCSDLGQQVEQRFARVEASQQNHSQRMDIMAKEIRELREALNIVQNSEPQAFHHVQQFPAEDRPDHPGHQGQPAGHHRVRAYRRHPMPLRRQLRGERLG
eukprot:1544027-Pyramimonas_sp.AAC.1